MTTDVPAFVLGAGINGLGVARSLARARVPTWLLDTDVRRPEMHTRAAKPLPIAALHGDVLVDELVRLGEGPFAGQRPVLLMTQEECVRTISRTRERLAPLYRFSLPAPDRVEALQHKQGFQQLAELHGAPIPALVRVQAEADLPALQALRYPVVVKPGTRDDAYGRQFQKAYRIEDASAATELVRSILPVLADVVVQEWTEGPDSSIFFCLQHLDRRGHVTASFTGCKVRAWPPQVGGTASCMPAPEAHAPLSALTARFFQQVGVIGMAGMEYKRDVRTGEFRMVEPTIGRTDYQAEVATLNGVNLPYAAYCAEVGVPFEAAVAPPPLAWRLRFDDDRSASAQQQPRDSGFGNARVCDALWRLDDPMPFVVANARRIAGGLRSRAARWLPRQHAAEGER